MLALLSHLTCCIYSLASCGLHNPCIIPEVKFHSLIGQNRRFDYCQGMMPLFYCQSQPAVAGITHHSPYYPCRNFLCKMLQFGTHGRIVTVSFLGSEQVRQIMPGKEGYFLHNLLVLYLCRCFHSSHTFKFQSLILCSSAIWYCKATIGLYRTKALFGFNQQSTLHSLHNKR